MGDLFEFVCEVGPSPSSGHLPQHALDMVAFGPRVQAYQVHAGGSPKMEGRVGACLPENSEGSGAGQVI